MSKRFEGDGRQMIEALPQHVLLGTGPLRIRRSSARMIASMFDKSGCSSHSGLGGTLWVILEHCEANGIKYTVKGTAGGGFFVERQVAEASEPDLLNSENWFDAEGRYGPPPGSVKGLKEHLAAYGLRVQKTANVPKNVGVTAELALLQLIHKHYAGKPQ
jgi:hypothetical protein